MVPIKQYTDNIHLLKNEYRIGKERRLNWTKHVLEEGTPMPRPVVLKDIDEEFINWVENDLDISYNGVDVPTLKTFSNQRVSEYIQSWQFQDSDGNIRMNLKTATRESNPKWGKMYEQHNIPSHRTYSVYFVPVIGENGQVTYDRFSITQPIMEDLSYTVQIITNKMELLNDFNVLVNSKFTGLQCYLFPLGYAMPMVLEDISDESEYNIDNRKYYAQSYKIHLKAYIIRPEDIEITKMPTRWKPSLEVVSGKVKKKDKDTTVDFDYREDCKETVEHTTYAYRNVIINANTGLCNKPIEFTYKNDSENKSEFVLRDIELSNVSDIRIFINGEEADIQGSSDVKIIDDDSVRIEYRRKDILKDGEITLSGYDSLTIINEDEEQSRESALDDKPEEKDRVITLE